MILWGIFLRLLSVNTGLSDPCIECRGTVNAYVAAELLLYLHLEFRQERRSGLAAEVGGEGVDGDNLEVPSGSDFFELGHARHGAVGIEDLDEGATGSQSGEACEVEQSLGVTGAAEHSVGMAVERKHVSGTGEVVGSHISTDERLYRGGAVVGGDTCGAAVSAEIHRHGEGCAKQRSIVFGHLSEPELVASLLRQGCAEKAAAVGDHEVDFIGSHHLAGKKEIAFVLAVFVVYSYDYLALLQGFESLGYCVCHFCQVIFLIQRAKVAKKNK